MDKQILLKQVLNLAVVYYSLLLILASAASQTIVKTLPGYNGDLPFSLETGYIGVGETKDVQLFYYFVESQRTPSEDPLLFWLTGGPGCSTLLAFFYESGPLEFTYTSYNGSLPSLRLNPYTWTKGLNIIYVDEPVGTGFSYSKTSEGYVTGDYKAADTLYQFLKEWLLLHPHYKFNQFYVGGDSYSGFIVPVLIQQILDGNDDGSFVPINMKGYVLGNPKTDTFLDDNARVLFDYQMTLIPEELYKATKESCNGNYVYVNESNYECEENLDVIEELISQINLEQVLEPSCSFTSPKQDVEFDRRSMKQLSSRELMLLHPRGAAYWCRNYNHQLAGAWANDKSVQEALNIREGTVSKWKMCNSTIAGTSYTTELASVIDYHKNFTNRDLRAIIYSGDHDMSIPHIATREWIIALNMSLDDSWRPWFVNAQVAGYTEEYSSNDYVLTFATVKGGGHIAAEYKPEQCASMLDRWFAYYPL